jgi:hypothetical protein
MTVLLNRAYQGYPAGSVAELSTDAESALIAQGLASTALGTAITIGSTTANVPSGTVAIGAAGTSVVITNSLIDANSKVYAIVAQSTADATLTSVVRVVCGPGNVQIFGNAAATATTYIDWAIINYNSSAVRN